VKDRWRGVALVVEARGIEDRPSKNSEVEREKDGSERTSIEREGQQQEERGMNDNATTALLPTTPMASSHM
jgi:hypothetical protein